MNSKKDSPFFSVIVPTYNRQELLKRCIQSILNQHFRDFELIVIDDGSTDATKSIVGSFEDVRIRYFYQQHNERSSARNKGIKHSKGRYLCFVDDDDVVLDNYLSCFHEAILKSKLEKPIVRCGFIKKTPEEETWKANFDPEKDSNPVSFFAHHMCGVGSVAIPREYLREDQFPEVFPHWQDTHLFLRLFAKYPFIQISNFSYIYFVHDEMGSQKSFMNETKAAKRIELNVAAIDDFFDNHVKEFEHLLKEDSQEFLTSQKYLEHAINCLHRGQKDLAKKLFSKSLERGLFMGHIKLYILYYFIKFFH